MLKSMTGFGRSKVENELREISVELKSVNHRYLDITVKVPRIYGFLEDAVKKALASEVARGKLEVFVNIKNKEGSDVIITPNFPVIDAYVKALKEISERYGLQNDATAMSVAKLPESISVDKEDADAETLCEEVTAVLENALREYNLMRTAEGEKLCEDILKRADIIEEYVSMVEKRSPESEREYREKISARMKEILEDSETTEARILAEAALFADKISVTEETVRLRSHLKQFREMVKSGKAVGRKLDFLVQEFNRETNTIGSKASDSQIAKLVIEMKAEIEKIREQIQNLE